VSHSRGDERDRERRQQSAPAASHRERPADVVGVEGEEALREAHQWVTLRVHFDAVRAQHSEGRVEKQRTEEVHHPLEPFEDAHPREDEDAAHDDGSEDAPEQHLALVLQGDAQGAEHEQEDEEIVDAERFLDEVAGKVLLCGLAAPPALHDQGEGQPRPDPHHAPGERVTRGHRPVSSSRHAEVDGEQHADDG